jgi:hypothetical protein
MALVLLISAHGGFIYRHDRPFSLEQVSESKHAAPFSRFGDFRFLRLIGFVGHGAGDPPEKWSGSKANPNRPTANGECG